MKKILLFIFLSFNIFAMKPEEIKWYDIDSIYSIKDKLEVGDIIVLNKLPEPITSSWGHIAIINKDKKFVEFPNIDKGYREIPLYLLETLPRKFTVLRYKDMNEELQAKIEIEMDKWVNKQYSFLAIPVSLQQSYTYCSLFVYHLFQNVIGNDFQITKHNDIIIFPYDFFDSEYLISVDLNK